MELERQRAQSWFCNTWLRPAENIRGSNSKFSRQIPSWKVRAKIFNNKLILIMGRAFLQPLEMPKRSEMTTRPVSANTSTSTSATTVWSKGRKSSSTCWRSRESWLKARTRGTTTFSTACWQVSAPKTKRSWTCKTPHNTNTWQEYANAEIILTCLINRWFKGWQHNLRGAERRCRVCRGQVCHESSHVLRARNLGHPQAAGRFAAHWKHPIQRSSH